MTAVSELIDETEAHLTGIVGGTYNRLAEDILTLDQQSFELEFDARTIIPFTVIGVGNEDIYILEMTNDTVTSCIRGFRGSTASTHSQGTLVSSDPRFTRFRMFRAIRQEIASWGSRLYAVDGADISTAADTRGYALSALGDDFLHVLKAYAEPTTTYTTNSSSWPEVEFRLGRNLNTSDFSGGNAIFFNDYLYEGTGRRVRLLYAKRFNVESLTTGTDLEFELDMPVSMHDIPPLGAAWRLMISQDVRRTDSMAQGQSRRAEETPPGAALQVSNALKAMRDSRIAEEQLSLLAKYGMNGGF